MINIKSMETLLIYANFIREGQFPILENQKFNSLGDFSSEWNDFVFYESARAAETIGYGNNPLAIFNDVLYA